jgi:hypothetical protein
MKDRAYQQQSAVKRTDEFMLIISYEELRSNRHLLRRVNWKTIIRYHSHSHCHSASDDGTTLVSQSTFIILSITHTSTIAHTFHSLSLASAGRGPLHPESEQPTLRGGHFPPVRPSAHPLRHARPELAGRPVGPFHVSKGKRNIPFSSLEWECNYIHSFLMPGYLSTRAKFQTKFMRSIMACRNPKANEQQIKVPPQSYSIIQCNLLFFFDRMANKRSNCCTNNACLL